MAVTIQLSAEIEQALRRQFSDIDQAAKEALLVELYRQDKLTHNELALALGLDRFEADALLRKHGVTEDLLTGAEYEAALSHLREKTIE
jgi:energy-converting hydrogenase A subunit M